jgi:hypothetical protein
MWINIIDYRGDTTVINSRGDSLFDYRTKYFLRQQDDFKHWQKHGHQFRCFSQHPADNNFPHFDDVVQIPRGNCQSSRNAVLDFYPQDTWIGMWDNDATLYWERFLGYDFPKLLSQSTNYCDNENIVSFVPFNSQQTPYPKVDPEVWTMVPKLEQKGTMMFMKTHLHRYDSQMTGLSDMELACRLTLEGYKLAECQNASLNELVNGKSTIFKVNAYHEDYKKPGARANPAGLLKWDAQLDRNDKYRQNRAYIENKLGYTLDELKRKQRGLWVNNNFSQLFDEEQE